MIELDHGDDGIDGADEDAQRCVDDDGDDERWYDAAGVAFDECQC